MSEHRILNISIDDLPQVGPLLETPREQVAQWTEAVDRLTQIATEALEIFTEATRRIRTALAQETPLAEEAAA